MALFVLFASRSGLVDPGIRAVARATIRSAATVRALMLALVTLRRVAMCRLLAGAGAPSRLARLVARFTYLGTLGRAAGALALILMLARQCCSSIQCSVMARQQGCQGSISRFRAPGSGTVRCLDARTCLHRAGRLQCMAQCAFRTASLPPHWQNTSTTPGEPGTHCRAGLSGSVRKSACGQWLWSSSPILLAGVK